MRDCATGWWDAGAILQNIEESLFFYFSTRHYSGLTKEKTSGRIRTKETAA